MRMSISLAEFVKHRNGVALGAAGSLRNMLHRSFGAGSFARFWHFWNPIWGYYLATKVLRPTKKFLPLWCAVLITFLVSGALHDVVISLAKFEATVLFTPWFFLMGLMVLLSKNAGISFAASPWTIRALINLLIITACLSVTLLLF